jgi:hypothetical protein
VKVVEEKCKGKIVKKEKGNDRISKLMEKITNETQKRRKKSDNKLSKVDRVKIK